jgi:mannitol-specific phosphotransferase system IIBC component
VFKVAGYTYGPLLGLFAFGMLTRLAVRDRWVPLVAVLSPLVTYMLDRNSEQLFGGYRFGFELLLVNAAITFMGLLLLRKR